MSEHDFGFWTLPNGQRARVTYNPRSRNLYLMRPAAGPGRTYEVLASFPDVEECRRVLNGWEHHSDRAVGLAWLLGVLDVWANPPKRRRVAR